MWKIPLPPPNCGKSPSPPTPKKIRKVWRICKFTLENPAIFWHFWGQKYTCKSITFFFWGLILLLLKGV